MALNKIQVGQKNPNKFKKKREYFSFSPVSQLNYIISQTLVKWFSDYVTENSSFLFNPE